MLDSNGILPTILKKTHIAEPISIGTTFYFVKDLSYQLVKTLTKWNIVAISACSETCFFFKSLLYIQTTDLLTSFTTTINENNNG